MPDTRTGAAAQVSSASRRWWLARAEQADDPTTALDAWRGEPGRELEVIDWASAGWR